MVLPRLFRCSAAVALAGLLLAGAAGGQDDAAVRQAVAADLARRQTESGCGAAVRPLYEGRGFAPLWLRDRAPTPQAAAVIDRLRRAGAHGLDAAAYGGSALESRRAALQGGAATDAELAEFEVALSSAVACYADHLHRGRVSPRQVGFDLDARPPLDAAALLVALAWGEGSADGLEAVAPRRAEYLWLIAALARQRDLAARATAPSLPELGKLAPGDVGPAVPLLRARLRDTGDLEDAAAGAAAAGAAAADPEVYDEVLASAVRRFQRRHGLAEDAVVGPRTQAALRVPLGDRVRQIELALERWRWLPPRDQRSVVVNVPEFRVRVYEPGVAEPALAMKVVVGSAAQRTRTVIFAADIKYLVFRPFWHVPRSIAAGEMLPSAARDPGYLGRKGIEVLGDAPLSAAALRAGTVRLRQKPGGGNSMGLIKFMFPNRYNIYMHDTPAKALFARDRRDFSHGCIRLEDAESLATLLLAEQGWDRQRVAEAVRGRDSQHVSLERPVPVTVFYVTAVAAPDGTVSFHDDIYGHDRTLDTALRAAADR